MGADLITLLFFSGISGSARINKLISPDFKKQLIILSTQGIELHKVAASEAISKVLKGHSIRTMYELPEKKVLVKTQLVRNNFLLDLNTLATSDFELDDYTISWKSIVDDKEGNVWGLTRDTLMVKYSMESRGYEKYTVDEAFQGVMVMRKKGELIYIGFNEKKQQILLRYDIAKDESFPILINGEPTVVNGYIHNMHYSKKYDVIYVAGNQGLFEFDFKNQKRKVFGFESPFP